MSLIVTAVDGWQMESYLSGLCRYEGLPLHPGRRLHGGGRKVYVLGRYARVEVVQAAAAASGSTRAGRDRHAPRGECVGSGAEGPSRRRIHEAPGGGN